MFGFEEELLKVGKKVVQVSDGTIWTVTKRLSSTNWALERTNEKGKTLVSILSSQNNKFSTTVNSYTFDIVSRVTISANSEEEARKQLPLAFLDANNEDSLYEIDEVVTVSKNENE